MQDFSTFKRVNGNRWNEKGQKLEENVQLVDLVERFSSKTGGGKIKKGRKKEEMDNGAAIKNGRCRDWFLEITARALEIDTLPLWKSDDERGVFFAKCHDYVSRTSNVSRIYRWIIIIERRIVSNNCNVSNSDELFFVELFPGSPRFSSTICEFELRFPLHINRD